MKRKSWMLLFTAVLLLPLILVLESRLGNTQVARGKSSAVPLQEVSTPEQQLAQDIALLDARVLARTAGKRAEVFGVRDVGNHFPDSLAQCGAADCRQVEIYLFDENAAVTVIVNLDSEAVLDVYYQPGLQPGINKRLADLAVDIAINHPDVIEALGYRPSAVGVTPVAANLLDSACAGDHLCVSPTFHVGDQTLFAIVDLTDETLAAAVWSDGDYSGGFEPFIPEGCPPGGVVNQNGWSVSYDTTGTDGFRAYDVSFNGQVVAESITLVEWHADYGSWGFIDKTGCGGGGGGFPIYPYGNTEQRTLLDGQTPVGFELVQDFRMGNWGAGCNYRYQQHMQFFDDGRFRVVAGAFGKGCANNALYRPVTRIDIDVDGPDGDSYARWDGANWNGQAVEEYFTPYADGVHGPHVYDSDGFVALISDSGGAGYYMEPGQGQFGDGGRGDEPFLYVTKYRASEGATDLPSIGNCCFDDHRQGPDLFVDGENVADENIVVWYVPQMLTDVTPGNYYCWTLTGEPNPETYPCYSGPMFVPISDPDAAQADFTVNDPIPLGSPAIFTNQSTGAGPITYEWDFGDGSPVSNEVNPTHLYDDNCIYHVTLTATNALNSDSITRRVFVNAIEPASFSANCAGGLRHGR